MTFENIPLSALVVWKYDSVTGEAVSNAVFQVKYLGGTSGTGGTVIGTYKTSTNGSFTVTGLKEGTYIVEELASDSGHVIDTAPQTAYISGKQQDVVQLYFGNSPKGSLLVKKIDSATHAPLSDVEFFVTHRRRNCGGRRQRQVCNRQRGQLHGQRHQPRHNAGGKRNPRQERLCTGRYAADGHHQAGQTVTLEFRNAPKGSLIIVKKDAVTGAPISDVEFLVTDSDGSVIGTANGRYVTDSAGTIRIDGLTPA